jgi:aromatic ring-opening dioxygenase LigB subunit
VVADGSAARTEKAPASLHPDASAFDGSVADALRNGDPARLASLDRDLAAEVSSAGWPAWSAAAAALGSATYDATLLADEAPFGVGYLVATWIRR